MHPCNDRPFIIWTLQRTGGTNLAMRLTKLSRLPSTEHDPFTQERKFGKVTRHWIKNQDRAALDASVEKIARTGVVIKHCVEAVPWEISESLALAAAKAGYRHLFLYRRNALDRLLSLHFAQNTGVWGPLMKARITEGREADHDANLEVRPDDAYAQPLPVEKLIDHERHCLARLTRTWKVLHAHGAEPMALAYEDVYRATDEEQPLRVLAPVLDRLGLMTAEFDLGSWAADLLGRGDQGTRDKYRRFAGVEKLAKQLQSLAPFSPNTTGDVLS